MEDERSRGEQEVVMNEGKSLVVSRNPKLRRRTEMVGDYSRDKCLQIFLDRINILPCKFPKRFKKNDLIKTRHKTCFTEIRG